MQASDVMTTNVVSVGPKTGVRDIAQLMLKHQVSGVPVVDDEQRVIGIVSEGDLIRRVEAPDASTRSWWLSLFSSPNRSAQDYVKVRGHYADEIMTHNVIEIGEEMALSEIAGVLERHKIKRVPVTRDGKLIGIVSRANLLHGLASQTTLETTSLDDREIRRQVKKELSEGAGLNIALVNVIVKNGVVQLWGIVNSPEEQQAAQVAAENAPGVQSVENNLGHISKWM